MPIPLPDENEIIAILKRTSLPTILVEGPDDAAIFRILENRVGVFFADTLVCSGRVTLLKVYRRRQEYVGAKVAWIADRDMWVFAQPDHDLDEVIFTEGYSIENDVYAGSGAESLLDKNERARHAKMVEAVCHWFTLEVQEYHAKRAHQVDINIKKAIDLSVPTLSAEYAATRNYEPLNSELNSQILANYKLLLRGKNLLQSLEFCVNSTSRSSRYTPATILDACLRLSPQNPYLERLVAEVRTKLSESQSYD